MYKYFILVFLYAIFFPLNLMLNENANIIATINTIGVLIGCVASIIIQLTPKISAVYNEMSDALRSSSSGQKYSNTSNDKVGTDSDSHDNSVVYIQRGSLRNINIGIKGKKVDPNNSPNYSNEKSDIKLNIKEDI